MSDKNDRETRSGNMREGMRRRSLLLGTTSLVAASGLAANLQAARAQQGQESILPKPEPPFHGKIGRTVKDSAPDFPKGVEAPAGAPNVLLIPGTSSVKHLRENLAAAGLELPSTAMTVLDGIATATAST